MKDKPTIYELEKILKEGDHPIEVLPDGSVVVKDKPYQLTDKQMEFLAKFMGIIEYPAIDVVREHFQNFEEADTRESVMNRAEEMYAYISFRKIGTEGDCCTCRLHKAHGPGEWVGYGPTRFIALINALMEASKNG